MDDRIIEMAKAPRDWGGDMGKCRTCGKNRKLCPTCERCHDHCPCGTDGGKLVRRLAEVAARRMAEELLVRGTTADAWAAMVRSMPTLAELAEQAGMLGPKEGQAGRDQGC